MRITFLDRLSALVVRVSGYRSRGPGAIPGATIFSEVVGLERGPLCILSTTEELLERKSIGSDLENREYVRGGSAALTTRQLSSSKSWH
jgi:hypothetical protein